MVHAASLFAFAVFTCSAISSLAAPIPSVNLDVGRRAVPSASLSAVPVPDPTSSAVGSTNESTGNATPGNGNNPPRKSKSELGFQWYGQHRVHSRSHHIGQVQNSGSHRVHDETKEGADPAMKRGRFTRRNLKRAEDFA
ncbi:hypothetical protein BDQ12DRAFT_725832 [Crucibulum laeve]|uniref:Uncharacterized protein n=1 Tax=Crucibulum laeve TaxID=68775 RepID=A0A5C3LRL4_9AGAR|nr:hypothetical protein BDQ12DRAFT_725832 [Crucibulum laeve]